MKLKLLVVMVLLIALKTLAQGNGRAIYLVEPSNQFVECIQQIKNRDHAKLLEDIIMELGQLRVEVLSSSELSVSRIQDGLTIEGRELYNATAKSLVCKGEYYQNSKENSLIHVRDVSPKKVGVVSSLEDSHWELKAEVREIAGLICHKAEILGSHIQNGKERPFKITAWFAPEIPMQSGFKGYPKLPGLIVVLIEPKFVFTLESFQVNEKLPIEIPPMANTFSREEFNRMSKDLIDQYKQLRF